MTEYAQAKNVVAALAKGINPLTGEVLPAHSPYNEPEIIRALFTVLNPRQLLTGKKSPEMKMEENIANNRPRNAGLPWTKENRKKLAKQFGEGLSLHDLANEFERTPGAIQSELVRQGLMDRPDFQFSKVS